MRRSTACFLFLSIGFILFVCMIFHARQSQKSSGTVAGANGELVKRLDLTDLCLFTEARYTRHPSMADIHSPFQDHPFALDHFPSGSLASPPHLRRRMP